jgi:hypothetical protein
VRLLFEYSGKVFTHTGLSQRVRWPNHRSDCRWETTQGSVFKQPIAWNDLGIGMTWAKVAGSHLIRAFFAGHDVAILQHFRGSPSGARFASGPSGDLRQRIEEVDVA